MKGFGEHWQLSVFFCVLQDIDRVRMQTALEECMNLKEDQTMIIDLGPDETAARAAATVLGQQMAKTDEEDIVVV
jgi:CRISPR/Cas system-associated endoribonuclease Cas2